MPAFADLEEEIELQLYSGSFPGAVVCVAAAGRIEYLRAFGHAATLPALHKLLIQRLST